jgi:hypothetical protein
MKRVTVTLSFDVRETELGETNLRKLAKDIRSISYTEELEECSEETDFCNYEADIIITNI